MCILHLKAKLGKNLFNVWKALCNITRKGKRHYYCLWTTELLTATAPDCNFFQSILSALMSAPGESALPSPQMILLPSHIPASTLVPIKHPSGLQGFTGGFASG